MLIAASIHNGQKLEITKVVLKKQVSKLGCIHTIEYHQQQKGTNYCYA